jgi:hypothetical protein
MSQPIDSGYPLSASNAPTHCVSVEVPPALSNRNRLTCLFRLFLAFPHLILVGAPAAIAVTLSWSEGKETITWGTAGLLGAVAVFCAIVAWFAILFTGVYPDGLRAIVLLFLGWRVRASAYVTLLRDEYPPFGDGPYPATLTVNTPPAERNRGSVAIRLLLAVPHLIIVWMLGIVWALTTVIAWFSILITGTFPTAFYRFGVGVLRWTTRVEAYLLLLHDEYPPFSLD